MLHERHDPTTLPTRTGVAASAAVAVASTAAAFARRLPRALHTPPSIPLHLVPDVPALRKAAILAHVLQWRLTWSRYDRDGVPPGLSEKFVSARAAAALIPDGAVVQNCGLAGHHRATAMYFAIRDRFADEGHPRDLTWCSVGAVGGRGKIPGTLEELGRPGLVTRFVTGHHETVKSFLRLASQGEMELHTIPQGEFALLIEAQADGELARETPVGVGTFLDPRVGPGSAVTPNPTMQLIEATDDGLLRYQLPQIEYTIFNVPYADAAGNLYATDAACLTEIYDSARAVHRNGGTVIAIVADVVPEAPSRVFVPAHWVDAIVVNPANEQTASIRQRHPWPMFTLGGHVDERRALGDVRMLNDILRVTPHRTASDEAVARLAASIMVDELTPGATMNIGVGLPEEASRLMYEAGINDDLHQTTETGVYGGVPTSGVFFGAAVNPERQESSSWVFHHYEERLDLACLGLLEVDGAGNVNVSRRGDDPIDYVGPGGFTDIAHHARTIVFVGSFAAHERLRLQSGRVVVAEQGTPKFVDAVREVTFNGQEALRAGKHVWYVTHRGVFRLTEGGLELTRVMPGIDVRRDILERSAAPILLPDGGPDAVPLVPDDIVTGTGFALAWPESAAS